MPKLIDADKLMDWMSGIPIGFTDKFEQRLKTEISIGTFDPTPSIRRPDVKPGDKVRHIDNHQMGIGRVKGFSASGKTINCIFEYKITGTLGITLDQKVDAYYRLDKLELVND